MFEADQSVGESLELSKVVDFAGHDFDVHFACKFNTDTVPEVGLFGKVEISPLPEEDGEQFSFNLIKVSLFVYYLKGLDFSIYSKIFLLIYLGLQIRSEFQLQQSLILCLLHKKPFKSGINLEKKI